MADVTTVSIDQVQDAARDCADRWSRARVGSVLGVIRGGLVPAALVAGHLDVRLVDIARSDTLVIDDLVDTGRTLGRFNGLRTDALFRKPHSPPHLAPDAHELDGWLAFPWEGTNEAAGPEDAIVRLLEYVGENPEREGLLDTPARVLRAFGEMTEGYGVDVGELLSHTFGDRCDEMVVVRAIEFTSLCEHHLLPFVGTATVAYVPGERVVGLSKVARLVDAYARRLQVQERLTVQIASAIEEHLAPLGVGVVVEAHHSCMGCRGVRKPGARMVTSAMLGVFRTKPEARSEFLALAGVAS